MNDNAKKWVAALRSGKYSQGTGRLDREGKVCCLGVGCKVALENGVDLTVTPREEPGGRFITRLRTSTAYDGNTLTLPDKVVEWLGLDDDGGRYGPIKEECGIETQDSLWHDNDINGKTFNQIADIIESEPEGLFKEAK